LGRYLINGGPPKSDRKKNIIYKIPCTSCNFCYIGETSQWFDEREKQHKRCVKNCDSNNGIYKHLEKHPDHVIAWDKATILDYERNYYARKMKESIYIDLFAKTGIMNLEDGMKKKRHYANPQKRNFREKFSRTVILLCTCICCFLKLSFPQDI